MKVNIVKRFRQGIFLVPMSIQSVGAQGGSVEQKTFLSTTKGVPKNLCTFDECSESRVGCIIVIAAAATAGGYCFLKWIFSLYGKNEDEPKFGENTINFNNRGMSAESKNGNSINIINGDKNNDNGIMNEGIQNEKVLKIKDIFVSKEKLQNDDLKKLFSFLDRYSGLSYLGITNSGAERYGQCFSVSAGDLKDILYHVDARNTVNDLLESGTLKKNDFLDIFISRIYDDGGLEFKVFKVVNENTDEEKEEEIKLTNQPYAYTLFAIDNVNDVISYFNKVFGTISRNNEWAFKIHLEKREDGIYIGTRSHDADKKEAKGKYFKLEGKDFKYEDMADLILSCRFGEEKPDPLSALFLADGHVKYDQLNSALLSLFSHEDVLSNFLDDLSLILNEKQFYTILERKPFSFYPEDEYHSNKIDSLFSNVEENFTVDFSELGNGRILLWSEEHNDENDNQITSFTSYAINRTDKIVDFLNYVLEEASKQKKLEYYLKLQCLNSGKERKVEVCKMSNKGEKLGSFILENKKDSQKNLESLKKFLPENKQEKVNEIEQNEQL